MAKALDWILRSFAKASAIPEWTKALQSEIDYVDQNQTFKFVKLPAGKHTIGSKWIFKAKVGSSRKIEKRKARILAQGDK
jgi:hypothetical protein